MATLWNLTSPNQIKYAAIPLSISTILHLQSKCTNISTKARKPLLKRINFRMPDISCQCHVELLKLHNTSVACWCIINS